MTSRLRWSLSGPACCCCCGGSTAVELQAGPRCDQLDFARSGNSRAYEDFCLARAETESRHATYCRRHRCSQRMKTLTAGKTGN
jgi:hypothetical protein